MIDHDPGDEDRDVKPDNTCPFCGTALHWSKVLKTPIFPPMTFSFVEEVMTPTTADRWMAEILTTCLPCKGVARRFATTQRMSSQEKTTRAYIRDLERRAGLRP